MTDYAGRDTLIACRNSQGVEFRATLLRLSRFSVIFEIYNPYSVLQLSEVLSDFQIVMAERVVYSGRAVISNLLNTGILLVCEVSLEDSWLDVDLFSPVRQAGRLEAEFVEFLREWEKIHRVGPDFKVVIADIQTLLMDLRRWLQQVELAIRSEPTGDRIKMEREMLQKLEEPMLPTVTSLFERFESVAEKVEEEMQPLHRNYVKRQLHPLVLCSPFVYRTFQKPLGYAGDYEMVNMILRDPFEGSSLFAKMVNRYFLAQPPAEAHRNRIAYLTAKLEIETARLAEKDRPIRILNLGCGPAREVQNFLVKSDLSDRADFTLLDFSDETLAHTGRLLEEVRARANRRTKIRMVRRSVHQILKDGARARGEPSPEQYDLIYCAGLFDYLSDRICKRLMNIFYDLLAPGGLLIATNVDASNPSRLTMEYVLEWHLIYRTASQLQALRPDRASKSDFEVIADSTGVNIFIEVKKPALILDCG